MVVKRKVPIKYLDRDFESIRQSLLEHAQRYYPNSFQDFSEAGFGSLMLDTVSYVGDILSFYLDYQANESYLSTAAEYDNIVKLARQIGYKMNVSPSSYGQASLYVLVPANAEGNAPNAAYMPLLKRGSTFSTVTNIGFVLNQDVNFADTNNKVIVAQVNETTGLPTSYAVQAFGQVVSGRYAQTTFNVGAYRKFPKFQMPGSDVCEIISIRDTEGNEYYEVENLSQNVIYKAITNTDTDDLQRTPSLLKPQVIARRFTVERQANRVTIQFGSGDETSDANSVFTEPTSVVLFQNGKDYVSDTAIDPTKLLQSNKLGVAPANTTLQVIYRTNTSPNVNASAATLSVVNAAQWQFEDVANLSLSAIDTVKNSLEINNNTPIVGDVSLPSAEEIRLRASSVFSSQNRAVTRQDYITLMYSMPERFGVVKKANIIQDDKSFKRNMNAYVISEDASGYLASANTSLKNNLKMWLNKNKMITDSIDILDAKIVNFGIDFEAVGETNQDNSALHSLIVTALTTQFTKYFDISENLYISDMYAAIKNVPGVLDVISVAPTLKVGGSYSEVFFDMAENTSADGRMVKIPQNVILELKFPNTDIKGVLK